MIKHAQQVSVAENESKSAALTADDHIGQAPRIAIQAFCETVETAAAVQAAGEDRRLGKAHVKIQMGGVVAAAEAYRNSPTPNVIVIESENHSDEILRGLDQLAEVCDAGTRLVVIGRVNDVTLYRELTRRGVSDYLIAPVGTVDIVRAICGLFSAPDAKPLGRVIAVVGAKRSERSDVTVQVVARDRQALALLELAGWHTPTDLAGGVLLGALALLGARGAGALGRRRLAART